MGMKITSDVVASVAKLARLELTDAEIKKFAKDMNDILMAFKDLDKAPVKAATKPSFQPVEIKDVLRNDVAEQSLTQDKALANAKHRENGFFKGPRAV